MIASACPSCGAPLTFRSAAALTVVCASCASCIVRDADTLRDFGKIARFQRELSPLQVGARGRWGGRDFGVVGVVRRGRARVRWNEWSLAFADGTSGWLGEGNGLYQLFDHQEPRAGVAYQGLRAGTEALNDKGGAWIAGEVAQAAVYAAEGELPYAVQPGVPVRYADLRRRDGVAVATLDYDDDPPTLWTGKVVTLPSLELQGLRPFTGWSDPVLTQFAGPEITSVRRLTCTGCGATLTVRAPGQSLLVACEQCGRSTDLDPDDAHDNAGIATARVAERLEKSAWKPPIPLGARGTLAKVAWEVIGAMERYVTEEGVDYVWAELLLHNPYRGFAWLVQGVDGHWSYVELLPCLPEPTGRIVNHQGQTYRLFQAGPAKVRRVLGEFTWEIAVGDTADTADYVAPPRMLSREATPEEVVWSLGTWLPAADVSAAFKTTPRTPEGIAPHQPNPFKEPRWIAQTRRLQLGLLAAAALTVVLALVLPANEPLLVWTTAPQDDATLGAAQLSEPFTVPDSFRDTLDVAVHPTYTNSPDVLISFIRADADEVVDWTVYGRTVGTFRLAPGTWIARVEVPDPTHGSPGSVKLDVVHDPPRRTPPILLLVYALAGLILAAIDTTRFEAARWSNSSLPPLGGGA